MVENSSGLEPFFIDTSYVEFYESSLRNCGSFFALVSFVDVFESGTWPFWMSPDKCGIKIA